MSESDGGRSPERPQELPYGLTFEQLLAITHAPRYLRGAAEALQLYTPAREHANQARYAAEWITSVFPDVKRYWERVLKAAQDPEDH